MTWFRDLYGFTEGSSYSKNRDQFRMEGEVLVCESAPPASRRQHVGEFECPSVAELRARVSPLVRRDSQPSFAQCLEVSMAYSTF